MAHDKQPEKQPENQGVGQGVNWDEQIEFLRGLALIVKEEHLSELNVESGGVRLHFKGATPGLMMVAAPSAGKATGSVSGAAQEQSESRAAAIVSPMVGVFYRAPSPGEEPFVEVGDTVHVGQVIGVVEAMKVFNEIISDIEGTVVEIVAQDTELVETGAPLVRVRKS
ncbi:MAG TPA: acetyl-CoA carboxylase [Abditibacteriaceae bacterium]|jgi:acetyl-CoA carboxylase biotin carboxyl carrier protein